MRGVQRKNLKHYLQNVFTVLNFKFYELDIPDNDRDELLDLIKTASLIIANEDVFLGKNGVLFCQDLELFDLLDFVLTVLEVDEQAIELDVSIFDFKVSVDKNQFIDALKVFLLRILGDASMLKIYFKNKCLFFEHDSQEDFLMNGVGIEDCFSSKNLSRDKIIYLLYREVLRLMGMDVVVEGQKLKICFT